MPDPDLMKDGPDDENDSFIAVSYGKLFSERILLIIGYLLYSYISIESLFLDQYIRKSQYIMK